MGRPSDSQLNFVSDIEKGCRALLSQGIEVRKIAQVSEAAGRDMPELSQFVGRFVDQGHWALIDRLAKAFELVKLSPLCIERAMNHAPKAFPLREPSNFDSEPLHLIRELPVAETNSKALVPELSPTVDVSIHSPEPEEVLGDVIRRINRLSQPMQRKKVAGMAANWFGVGG